MQEQTEINGQKKKKVKSFLSQSNGQIWGERKIQTFQKHSLGKSDICCQICTWKIY